MMRGKRGEDERSTTKKNPSQGKKNRRQDGVYVGGCRARKNVEGGGKNLTLAGMGRGSVGKASRERKREVSKRKLPLHGTKLEKIFVLDGTLKWWERGSKKGRKNDQARARKVDGGGRESQNGPRKSYAGHKKGRTRVKQGKIKAGPQSRQRSPRSETKSVLEK